MDALGSRTDNYIDLGRKFYELSEKIASEEERLARTYSQRGKLSWNDLTKESLVVILSEAGSGKTTEIYNIAKQLSQKGKKAFFLRLEHIPGDFEGAFEVGTFEGFNAWLDSNQPGWLFLDSVDEARLRDPRDFESAVRKIGRKLGSSLFRTHIVITGRTVAWRPKSDLKICSDYLLPTSNATEYCSSEDQENVLNYETSNSETESKNRHTVKLVELADLTSDQIGTYLRARNIKDQDKFLAAIERADAFAYTARPQDLEELVDFWVDKGDIGSRLDLIQHSINRRLTERDQNRDDIRTLPTDRIREGARLLAAATTLTHNPTITVPDGAESSSSISSKAILNSWNTNEISILLSRPIFDEAIYGGVRFHHRSVREFLTAEWFASLLQNETSRRAIEALFFSKRYGHEIIVPTLRPILPWLILLDGKILDRITSDAPEVIFEGGDPSLLPLDTRKSVLKEVCSKMDSGEQGRNVQGYEAVQRFANDDLGLEILSLLRLHRSNEDVIWFLLRMVWQGQIRKTLPEVRDIANSQDYGTYTQIAAFRALKAIGSTKDVEDFRLRVLSENIELDREFLSELISSISSNEESVNWVFSCIQETKDKEKYSVDGLADSVKNFVCTLDDELLSIAIDRLYDLITREPIIDRRHCDISSKYGWLILSAEKALERLILDRHPNTINEKALSILILIRQAEFYHVDDSSNLQTNLNELVPGWAKLNRALFWFVISEARSELEKEGKRLVHYSDGWFKRSYWQFEEKDFEWAVEQISTRKEEDDKLVALSLSFALYVQAGRGAKRRNLLKKATSLSTELSSELSLLLNPPPQTEEELKSKRRHAYFERRAEVRRKKRESHKKKSRDYLTRNIDKMRDSIATSPGTLTSAINYLFSTTCSDGPGSRWTEYNWRSLIPEFGEEVAMCYRDAAVALWRNYIPRLRSEGESLNQTMRATIVGLAGLEIESIEIQNWADGLSKKEVMLACRYASFELNGFPPWLKDLYRSHPLEVNRFLFDEVIYEISIESINVDTHHIISDIGNYARWAWDGLADQICTLLNKEPVNLSNLDGLQRILMGTNLEGSQIEKLARSKCLRIKQLDHLGRWYAIWVGISPEAAIPKLERKLASLVDDKKQTHLAMVFITSLLGGRSKNHGIGRHKFKRPEHLKALYLLIHKYVRTEDDINRAGGGVYSPELRDNAQDGRNALLHLLEECKGKSAYLALRELGIEHPNSDYRAWMLEKARNKAITDGDISPWLPQQIVEFNNQSERTPVNHNQLAELAILRLLDLKDDLENGDNSIATVVKRISDEPEMRNFVGRELREKAFGRYSVPQEEEMADGKKPDLRFNGNGFDNPVPVELKLAERWTGPKLFERLRNQLCGDYLRDRRSSVGIYLLIYKDTERKQKWNVSNRPKPVAFEELLNALGDYWNEISGHFPNIEDIHIIGINLETRG